MDEATQLCFWFPAVGRKKVTAAFDGGRITSDGGVMLLSQADVRLGLCNKLAGALTDARDQDRVAHSLASIVQARVFAIACGYEDGNDLNALRSDPAFKLACGSLPETGLDLCSQPTVSRLENAPSLKDLIRLQRCLADVYCQSYGLAARQDTFGERSARPLAPSCPAHPRSLAQHKNHHPR